MPPIPRVKPYDGPPLFSYGFRPFFLGASLFAGLAVALWLPAYFGELSLPTAYPALVLAYPRDDLRLRRGGRRRLHPDGDPQLDRPFAAARRQADRAFRLVARRPVGDGVLGADRRHPGGGDRPRLPRAADRLRRARTRPRRPEPQSQGRLGARRAVARRSRLPCRGDRAGLRQLRRAHRPRRADPADHADRRPHHSELHPQLAGADESGRAAGAGRPLGRRGDRPLGGRAGGLDRRAERARSSAGRSSSPAWRRRRGWRAGAAGGRGATAWCWSCTSPICSCRSASC